MLSSKEIRRTFIEFFEERAHKFVPSSPVVPNDDPTLLFTNAGMNQFKDIFLGVKKKNCDSAVNSQKCIRVSGKHNDLEEVGVDTYHHTFFEMLGNWSFDAYFKREAIQWAWQLLTEVYKIDKSKLYVTVFEGDEQDGSEYDAEAAAIWPALTDIAPERVLAFGKKDNFWEMGETGPCGPCSEIHIDRGEGTCDMQHIPGHVCGVNAGCSRFMELWNLVFIQFNRQSDGSLMPLKAKYIDTGAGLERLCSILQDKASNYDTDLFTPLLDEISRMCSIKYECSLTGKTDIAMRVIADHIRSLSFAITDGAVPGNDGRGYALRRILRRAARFGRVLGLKEPFIYKLVPTLVDCMGEAFPEIKARAEFVQTVLEAEEKSFGRTLDRGLEIFEAAADKAPETLPGDDAFQLYDTFGFPLDLTELLAREKGLKVDTVRFEELMEQQRERARAAQKGTGILGSLDGAELPETDDTEKYLTESCRGKLLGVVSSAGYADSGEVAESDETICLVLDKTCCYAESGGQVGDTGEISAEGFVFEIEKTNKMGHCVLHQGRVLEGHLKIGESVTVSVSGERAASQKNHTATHLLQWALRNVLGDSVTQQGSLVCPDYLRFDFTSPKALTAEQLKEVETQVNDKICAAYPVNCATMDIEDAKKLGAMALFGEKYGDEVRVVFIGDGSISDAFSKEFCGGTHVSNTALIGGFKVIKEESVSAGVRRITALTGRAFIDYLNERCDTVDGLCSMLKLPFDQLVDRVQKLIADNKDLQKQLKEAKTKGGSGSAELAAKVIASSETIGESLIAVVEIDADSADELRACADALKAKTQSYAALLICKSGGKVLMVSVVAKDLIDKGIKAGDIVKLAAAKVGGGGGGRPDMAQAGGKDPAGIPQAINEALAYVKSKL
ncbi:MAG: alanine--tRNA ligase [Phycisphaerae bacterium]